MVMEKINIKDVFKNKQSRRFFAIVFLTACLTSLIDEKIPLRNLFVDDIDRMLVYKHNRRAFIAPGLLYLPLCYMGHKRFGIVWYTRISMILLLILSILEPVSFWAMNKYEF